MGCFKIKAKDCALQQAQWTRCNGTRKSQRGLDICSLAGSLACLLACLLTERVAVVPFFGIGTPYRCDQSQHCPSFPLDLRSFPSSKRASPPFRDCFLVDHTGRSLCSSAGNFVFHATAPGTAHELSQRYSATHSCLSSRLTSSTYIDDMSYIIDQHSRERRIEGRERERGRER